MLVSQIIKDKGETVITISPDSTLAAAAQMLRQHRVGALVVSAQDGDVLGILSERDIVWGLAGEGAATLERLVSDCMTRDVIVAQPQDTLDGLLARMTDRRVRHLPIVRNGRLAGIVSIGDLVKHKINEVEAEAHGLKQYIAAG